MTVYGWSPGIGDPTVLGWITVAAYLAAATLCLLAARQPFHPARGEAGFWALLTIGLVALGINKQLDLQSLFTAVARHNAHEAGWYTGRRHLQLVFIVGIALAGGVGALLLAWTIRRYSRPARIAGVGAALLVAFVVIRAASFHHVDLLLRGGMAGIRLNHVLELGGILVIAASAAAKRSRSGRAPGRYPARRPG